MYKKLLYAGFGVMLLATPLVTSAATVADLQAQIANLIAQIRQLQETGQTSSSTIGVNGWVGTGVGVSGSGSVSAGATTDSSGMPCFAFSRSLARGSQGDDVRSLQQFLYAQGFFDGYVSGYFGAQTESSLEKWQEHEGVAMRGHLGFGIFGPHSRIHFKDWCQNPGHDNHQSFSADPQSGPAPLTTTFTTSDSITASTTQYSVDFGDGTNTQMTKGSCIAITAIRGGQGGIRCSYTVAHTYNANGTYTAKLLKHREWSCPNGMMCAAMMPAPQVVGTLTITVGSTTSQTLTANPTSGTAPLSVSFSVPGIDDNYWSINFGDGQTQSLVRGPITHTYANAGTYTASAMSDAPCLHVSPACAIAQQTYGSATITVSGTSTPANDQQINAPASVTLTAGGIAEVRNKSFYFTLTSLSSASATIQLTQVGCWNSFPSDTPPQIRCMIAVMPIPPVTLSVGQTYSASNYAITLTNLTATSATFQVSTMY